MKWCGTLSKREIVHTYRRSRKLENSEILCIFSESISIKSDAPVYLCGNNCIVKPFCSE